LSITHLAAPLSPLDHGAIGNGQVLALVAPDTHVEWLCLPRFDSPSVFARILDRERGGSFGFAPAEGAFETRMAYVPNTNVLRTSAVARDGSFEVHDFAPRIPKGLTVDRPIEVQRLLVPAKGTPRIRVLFDPRPDYARAPATFVESIGAIEIRGGAQPLWLQTNVPIAYVLSGVPFHLDRPCFFTFSYGRPSESASVSAVQRDLELTIAGWRAWAKTCALPSFAPDLVLRSALCLKLHAFEDTGAIIAAATTSIPEALGTERNWDYRYCWLRDAAFVVEALRRLSHLAEGEAFVRFLHDVTAHGPLQPVYGIGGERDLTEIELDHLAGYGGSRPVRIGNAASLQHQHDLMGEMVLCLETLMTDPRIVGDGEDRMFALVERLVGHAIEVANSEDTGPWEFRTMLRHYTFSKALCWAAAHRGERLATRHRRPDLAARWGAWARTFGEDVLRRSFNTELGFFTQGLDGEHPDASNLLLPTLGIVDAKDPRFVSTVRAYERRLVDGGLMLRYRHPDDFGATTSAFTICSFWWVEALAMMGELDEAITLFRRIVSHANPVGLLSEDIDPRSGALLGNFPQAYTHVGLIHAAITIGESLDAREGHFRAWT